MRRTAGRTRSREATEVHVKYALRAARMKPPSSVASGAVDRGGNLGVKQGLPIFTNVTEGSRLDE